MIIIIIMITITITITIMIMIIIMSMSPCIPYSKYRYRTSGSFLTYANTDKNKLL